MAKSPPTPPKDESTGSDLYSSENIPTNSDSIRDNISSPGPDSGSGTVQTPATGLDIAEFLRLKIESYMGIGKSAFCMTELAHKVDISPSMLSRFVNRQRSLGIEAYNKVGAHFGLWIVPTDVKFAYRKYVDATMRHFLERDPNAPRPDLKGPRRGPQDAHLREFLTVLLGHFSGKRSWRAAEELLGVNHVSLYRFASKGSDLSLENIDKVLKAIGISICSEPPEFAAGRNLLASDAIDSDADSSSGSINRQRFLERGHAMSGISILRGHDVYCRQTDVGDWISPFDEIPIEVEVDVLAEVTIDCHPILRRGEVACRASRTQRRIAA